MSGPERGPTQHDLDDNLVEEILERTSGRSRCVVEEILDHGYVTTVTLGELGYDHPPRAAADVRDRGIPLETVMKTVDGKKIAHYRFPDDMTTLDRTASGRIAISKQFQQEVINCYGERDIFTGTVTRAGDLQIDHRVPFRISGDPSQPFNVNDFMPVSAAMNRLKSFACEGCPNWMSREMSICKSCYWAGPDRPYEHVATVSTRRLDLVWQNDEVVEFDHLLRYSDEIGSDLQTTAKRMIGRGLSRLDKWNRRLLRIFSKG